MARAPASVVVALLVVRLADEASFFLPSAALESFRADLGLTYTQAGSVLALIAPGALVGTAFTVAADRYSRRVIASGGAFAFAAGMAVFAWGGSFALLAAGGFAIGAASTAMVDAAEVALVDVAGDDLRPYLARANLLATIGDLMGPALVGAVAVVGLSWRATFWVGAAGLVVYGIALGAAPLPGPAPPEAASHGGRSSVRVLASVARDPRVWLVGLMSLLMGPFDEPLTGFTIALVERDLGGSAVVATLVALVGLSGGIFTYTVLARRVVNISDSRLLVVSGLTMTAGAAAIAAAAGPALVAVGAFVTSIGVNVGWLGLQHRTLTLRPGEVGSTKAVVTTIEFAGAAVPIGIGAVADAAGLVAAVAVFAMLGLLFTVFAVTAILMPDAVVARPGRGWADRLRDGEGPFAAPRPRDAPPGRPPG